MRMRASSCFFVCMLAVAEISFAASTDQQVNAVKPHIVDFSGSWELDYKLTEDPRDKLRWLYEVARSQIQQQNAAMRDPSGRGRMPNDMNRRAINNLEGIIGLGSLAEMMARSVVLTVKQSEDYIMVERQGDFSLTCDFIDGQRSGTNLGEEYCGFDSQGQLIFIVSLPEGLTVRNRLVLSQDGSRLNVATTVRSSNLSQEFTLNRVYMPFEAGKGLYECTYTLAKKKTCWLRPSE